MMRTITAIALSALVGGCSLGGQSDIALGLNDGPAERSSTNTSLFSGSFTPKSDGKSTPKSQTRVASLDDRPTRGSYAKAPKGALADRNYGGTALDPQAALGMVNAYRRENGLRPLKLDAALTKAAKAHSRDLAKWDRISHYGSDGSNPWDRVKRTGFKARLAAENVGTGQASLEEVFRGWQKSPGHNKNLLLPDATHMGIALVTAPRTEFKTFWTLVLGTPL